MYLCIHPLRQDEALTSSMRAFHSLLASYLHVASSSKTRAHPLHARLTSSMRAFQSLLASARFVASSSKTSAKGSLRRTTCAQTSRCANAYD